MKVVLSILAGVGVSELADKILPSRVSGYEPVSPGLKAGRKLALFVGTMGAGALAWNFVNKKFHILTPRHSPRRRRRRGRRR